MRTNLATDNDDILKYSHLYSKAWYETYIMLLCVSSLVVRVYFECYNIKNNKVKTSFECVLDVFYYSIMRIEVIKKLCVFYELQILNMGYSN